MKDLTKYKGIIPAFYACYSGNGKISPERTQALATHLLNKGVRGLYICGSSGECIYQSVSERKITLENVMKAVKGKLTVIAHVACNNTADSVELACHAESLGVDAIASIPPIYFHLPDHAIATYWNDISAAAPNTDFIIYNIPQLAGVALSPTLCKEMVKNPRVIGVKNSSMSTQDIELFHTAGGEGFIVFNGPDEQLVAGLAIGADGGIGGTYTAMPELYLKIYELVLQGKLDKAKELQYKANSIIYALCGCQGNMYAVIKEVLRIREGIDIGGVRAPLANITADDIPMIKNTAAMIDVALAAAAKM